jgi:hypothetical protein
MLNNKFVHALMPQKATISWENESEMNVSPVFDLSSLSRLVYYDDGEKYAAETLLVV